MCARSIGGLDEQILGARFEGTLQKGLYGVAANSAKIIGALSHHPKSTHYLLNCKELFQRHTLQDLPVENHSFELVFVTHGFRDLKDTVFIETSRAANDEELLKEYLRVASHLA